MSREKLRKLVSNFLTIILVIYIAIGLLFYSILNISKNYINKDKIQKVINNIDISNIIKNNVEMDNIKNELIDTGLSSETVNDFLNSNEVKKFEEEVITNVIYDILNKGNIEYQLKSDEINKLIYNNISELQTSGTYNKVSEKIESKLPNLVDNVNKMIDKISLKLQNSSTFLKYKSYINKSLKIFDIIYSKLASGLIMFIIITFIILLMLIRKNIYKSFKWLGISFVFSAIILKAFSFLLKKIFFETKFNHIVEVVVKDFNYYHYIYLIIGIILIITNLIIVMIRRKKELKQ